MILCYNIVNHHFWGLLDHSLDQRCRDLGSISQAPCTAQVIGPIACKILMKGCIDMDVRTKARQVTVIINTVMIVLVCVSFGLGFAASRFSGVHDFTRASVLIASAFTVACFNVVVALIGIWHAYRVRPYFDEPTQKTE